MVGRGCSDKGKGKMFKEPVFEDHCETFKSKGKVRDKRDIFLLRFLQGDRERARVFETLHFCEKG